MGWFDNLPAAVQALIRVILFLLPVFMMLPVLIWYERRLLAWFQDRIGPNRTGTITFSRTSQYVPEFLRGRRIKLFGIPQIIADGIKSFFKEDFAPSAVDRLLYFLAPAVFLFPAFLLGATVPWGPFPKLTPIADVEIGLLYILAVSSLGVYGVVLAGYSSNNKYSLLGGLRSSAQLISYELGMGLSLAAVVMAAGSLRPTDIVRDQEGPLWGILPFAANWNILTPYGFVAGIIFFVCMLAETNRAPFDLPEAESELVAGYNTEYSTKKWVLFMMGEYVGMITYSIILSTVFFGGYHLLPIPFGWLAENYPATSDIWRALDWINGNSILAPVWILVKTAFFLTTFIWVRATLPRLRYDQLMSLGWKSLLPVSVANLMVVAMWIFVTRVYGPYWALLSVLFAAAILVILYRGLQKTFNADDKTFEPREITMDNSPAQRRTVEVVDPTAAAS
ncbi:MAG: complex I subunit 1/NuoH family protein [Fimbriimonas sp.]